ncbi:hypothetical protein Sjap_012276 [Stephania japonica]|uniref:Uncharacterized protein n=1 Tax=Stephania japonica TaxID=461633 RepID=A0AAP0IVT3_9MAGN
MKTTKTVVHNSPNLMRAFRSFADWYIFQPYQGTSSLHCAESSAPLDGLGPWPIIHRNSGWAQKAM